MVRPTYDDEPECGTICDACTNRIEAGEMVHTRTYREGPFRVCDWCDTNRAFPKALGRTKSAPHSCPCQPCQSRRLVGALVVSVAKVG